MQFINFLFKNMMTGQWSKFADTFYLAESAHLNRSDPDRLQNGSDSPTLLTHLCGDRFRVAVLPYSSAMIFVMYSVQSQL